MAFNISASPLSCQCGQVTITVNEIPSPRNEWGVFLFYVALVNSTQNFSQSLLGRYIDPQTDNTFDVTLPMNAVYDFYGYAIKEYKTNITYGLGDWVFNKTDKRLYVSKAGSNLNYAIDNVIWWRPFDASDIQTVVSHQNIASNTQEDANLELDVTCNTAFLGLGIKMKLSCDTSVQTLAINDKTGLFDIFTNPNGYGGINPTRGQYAQMQILTNTTSAGVTTSYYARAYSYRSALYYNFDIPRDGVYLLNTFLVQLWDSNVYYNANDAVFEEISNTFYKSLFNNNNEPTTNANAWVEITTLDEFNSSNYYKLCQNYFIQDANGRKLLYDLREGIKKSCPCNCDSGSKCGDDLWKKWMFVTMCIEDACFAKTLYKYEEAQCFLEKIPKNCSPYISIYKC